MTLPITDADYRQWQLIAHRALGELLQVGLPAIGWEVGVYLNLGGRVYRRPDETPADVERRWQAWVDYLQATKTPRRPIGDIGVELIAMADWGQPRVSVTVTAMVWREMG